MRSKWWTARAERVDRGKAQPGGTLLQKQWRLLRLEHSQIPHHPHHKHDRKNQKKKKTDIQSLSDHLSVTGKSIPLTWRSILYASTKKVTHDQQHLISREPKLSQLMCIRLYFELYAVCVSNDQWQRSLCRRKCLLRLRFLVWKIRNSQ